MGTRHWNIHDNMMPRKQEAESQRTIYSGNGGSRMDGGNGHFLEVSERYLRGKCGHLHVVVIAELGAQ